MPWTRSRMAGGYQDPRGSPNAVPAPAARRSSTKVTTGADPRRMDTDRRGCSLRCARRSHVRTPAARRSPGGGIGTGWSSGRPHTRSIRWPGPRPRSGATTRARMRPARAEGRRAPVPTRTWRAGRARSAAHTTARRSVCQPGPMDRRSRRCGRVRSHERQRAGHGTSVTFRTGRRGSARCHRCFARPLNRRRGPARHLR